MAETFAEQMRRVNQEAVDKYVDRSLMMNIDLNTWIISDTHFGHDNIVKFCKRPVYHNELMVTNWFETVKPEDTVLHLGDVGFGRYADIFMGGGSNVLKNIPGNQFELPGKKFLIKGNHDTKPNYYYEGFGFEIVEPFSTSEFRLGKGPSFVYFDHDPLAVTMADDHDFWESTDVIIHGHIHNNGYHPNCPEDIDYRNVSVEVMDYKPVRLRDILYGGKYQSRKDAGLNAFDVKKLAESNG
jgi:calcineurin-like phosphoesterase family protein